MKPRHSSLFTASANVKRSLSRSTSLLNAPATCECAPAISFAGKNTLTRQSYSTAVQLEKEPTYRTPKSAIAVPNQYTHRYVPSEEQLHSVKNKALLAEVFKVKDLPHQPDTDSRSYGFDGLPSPRISQESFKEKDVSQYELFLNEFQREFMKYKREYNQQLTKALAELPDHKLQEIENLVPQEFKTSAAQLKRERLKGRKKRAPKKSKKKDDVPEEDDEDPLAGGKGEKIASRATLRLSYKDNYKLPRFTFDQLRQELQMGKLMDNSKSGHRQYMLQCVNHLQENKDTIVRSLLKEAGKDHSKLPAAPKNSSEFTANIKCDTAVLPLDKSGVEVKFSSVGKDFINGLLRNREKTQDIFSIVDVRSRIRAFDNRLPGAVNVPLPEILKGALDCSPKEFEALYGSQKIPTRHTVIFYGDNEKDAIMASALAFLKHGYQSVYVYRGGVMDWFNIGYQPLWFRTHKTNVKQLNQEKFLEWYNKNSNLHIQQKRSDQLLHRYIQRRLPEDIESLQFLKKYAEDRIKANKKKNRRHLPTVGTTDYHDGVRPSVLLSLVNEKLDQQELLEKDENVSIARLHRYQTYYGPRSQRAQV